MFNWFHMNPAGCSWYPIHWFLWLKAYACASLDEFPEHHKIRVCAVQNLKLKVKVKRRVCSVSTRIELRRNPSGWDRFHTITFLNASRQHKELPKHSSDTSCWTNITVIGRIRFTSVGNRYHWNWSSKSLISVNALLKRWLNSQVMKTSNSVSPASNPHTNSSIEWFPWCVYKYITDAINERYWRFSNGTGQIHPQKWRWVHST